MIISNILLKVGLYWPLRRQYFLLRRGFKEPHLVFQSIFEKNSWGSTQSVSGPGSTVEQTRKVVEMLPNLLDRYKITSILDLPCGDCNWMSGVNFPGVSYIGADLVPELIKQNLIKVQKPNWSFRMLDLINDELPMVDVIFCRDCLVHFSFDDLRLALINIKKSGSKYLITTNFIDVKKNYNIATGDFRPINLELSPFNFPTPLECILEDCSEGDGAHRDKSLAVWKIIDLPYL